MWWIALALAQDPSPVRLCADAAEGTEVEVCLRLAAEHPDSVDGIAAALRAHIDRASTPDRELMLGLLLLLSEDTGVEAAQTLGRLDDPRAVEPLVHSALNRETDVAVAAATALAAYPAGQRALATWLVDRERRLEVRLAAVDALGSTGEEDAANAILDALRQPRMPPTLRTRMTETIRTTWPERATELEERVDRDGTVFLSLAGGLGLGYTLSAAGRLGQAPLAGLGATTGGVAGLSVGYLAGRAWPMEEHEAAFIATNGLLYLTAGVITGAALAPDDPNAPWYGGLAGMATGYTAGFALRKPWPGRTRDAGDTILLASAVGLGAGTAAAFADANGSAAPPALAGGIGLAAGASLGFTLSPLVVVNARDAAMIGLSAVTGAAVGGLVPLSSDQQGWLALTTTSAGALTGYVLSEYTDAEPSTLIGGATGGVLGAGFGTGLGLAVVGDGDPRGFILGGTLAGLTGGMLATHFDPNPLDDRDVVLTLLSTGFVSWQSAGWAIVAQADTRGMGVAILVPPLVGSGVALASREVDWPVTNALGATSLGLWGGYLGGTMAVIADGPPLPYALVGSDIGVLVGTGLMSPLLDTPPLVVALGDAGGILGGSLGALGTSFATTDAKPILVASLVGSGVGFAGGLIAGTILHRRGISKGVAWRRPRRVPTVALHPIVGGPRGSSRMGAAIEVSGW